MADNKQYITQIQENGSVMIAEEVINTIIAHAACEVEGVTGLNTRNGSKKGLKVTIGQSEELYIDCYVNIGYGQSVINVAKSVQEAVTTAVESMAGVKVASVNVNVCGIIHQ